MHLARPVNRAHPHLQACAVAAQQCESLVLIGFEQSQVGPRQIDQNEKQHVGSARLQRWAEKFDARVRWTMVKGDDAGCVDQATCATSSIVAEAPQDCHRSCTATRAGSFRNAWRYRIY